jgi:hypothetical protein
MKEKIITAITTILNSSIYEICLFIIFFLAKLDYIVQVSRWKNYCEWNWRWRIERNKGEITIINIIIKKERVKY